MDPNWIMAIIAIAAIVSPAVVSIIDNKYKYASKKLDYSYSRQQQALSDFITSAMEYYPCCSYTYVTKYITAKNNLLIYFSNIPAKELDKLEELANSKQLDEYKKCINVIVKKLSQEIKR